MRDTKMLQEIGNRIHARRRELNLTQEKLADRMDVTVQMISNLELGKKAIRPENLIKLCDALSISADYILRGTGSKADNVSFFQKYARLSPENQQILEQLVDKLI